MQKTEFFEAAVQQGFYGIHEGGLTGKKDNVRKYWEDISIKTAIRRPVSNLLESKERLRIVDLGSGSGEGYQLLTHIPPVNKTTIQRDFVITDSTIENYLGVDISPSMIAQGIKNYSGKENVQFIEADLTYNYSFLNEGPFDVYFSSYASPSHLHALELKNLIEKIFDTTPDNFVLALDLLGKYSPEWPVYWDSLETEMNPYNMVWLYPAGQVEMNESENFSVRYWDCDGIRQLISEVAQKHQRTISMNCIDRSILVGRHMSTGNYNNHPQQLRTEINKLFDRDYRGMVPNLFADISYLDNMQINHPAEYQRIAGYCSQWNTVIAYLGALINKNKGDAQKLHETASEELREEFQMLSWLEANSSRFPVVDFWASVMGPQVACVLRNLEFSLPEGLGCGHGLFCTIEVFK